MSCSARGLGYLRTETRGKVSNTAMNLSDQSVNRRQNFERFSRLAEWPMAILALILVPILIIENEAF